MTKRSHTWAMMICICSLLSISTMGTLAPRYDMDLVVDYDSGAFAGEVTVTYTNPTAEDLSEVFFRVFANDSTLYGDAVVNVAEVFVQSSSCSPSWYVGNTVLAVPLTVPLSPAETVEIRLGFEGQASIWSQFGTSASQNGYGILTKSPSSLTLTAFYPVLAVYGDEGWSLDPSTGFGDTLMSDAADYVVRVSARTGLRLVASGTLQTVDEADGGAVYTFAIDAARDFSLVLLDDAYGLTTDRVSDRTVNTWFVSDHLPAQRSAQQMAVDAFLLYEELIGPCLYDEIDLVEVPLQRAAGVEFSGLILVGLDYGDRPDDLFFSIIISHEMAHQWFYAAVGNDVSEHPWLDESFATYLSYVFLDTYVSPSAAEGAWDDARTAYANAQRVRADLDVTSPRYEFPSSSLYSAYVYSGGALLLDRLHQQLGHDVFTQAVQAYYRDFAHRMATPDDLFQAFEEACACSIHDVLAEFRIAP